MRRICVIHGPNLNLLGRRNPAVYGTMTLDEINREIRSFCHEKGMEVTIVQSNSEGGIIEAVQRAERCTGIVINPAGYTHTSVAIRDAIEAVGVRAIEVHISNVHAREELRAKSVIVGVCVGQITGLGPFGYLAALAYFAQEEEKNEKQSTR